MLTTSPNTGADSWRLVGDNWLVAIGWWQLVGGSLLVIVGWWQIGW